MKNRKERNTHPGWAVRFSDGTWLGCAHGWFTTNETFYADIYDSKEDAESKLQYVKKEHPH